MEPKSVFCAGAGVIGSYLGPHLARIPEVELITLADPDFYTRANIAGQNIDRSHVGRAKCVVQARLLKRIRPDLAVQAFQSRVEHIPAGFLRCDVICLCLDTRISRMYCCEIAKRLGVPVIDAAVLAGQFLVRITVYMHGREAACIECGFGEEDYRNLEIPYSCMPEHATSYATNAPSFLGALAAALQAAECRKILTGQTADSLAGKELVVGLQPHTHLVSRLRRNPDCRFDHAVWQLNDSVEPLLDKRLGVVLAHPSVELSALGGRFVLRFTCTECGRKVPSLRFFRRGQVIRVKCRNCGAACRPTPFDWADRITCARLSGAQSEVTFRSIGLRQNDVLTVTGPEGFHHFLAR